MAFATNCSTKGCRKFMEPYVDKVTKKVYCSECDAELLNINIFTINQMISSKQFKEKSNKAFSFKCKNCSKEDVPLKLNKDFVCSFCKEALNITESFKIILNEKLKDKKEL